MGTPVPAESQSHQNEGSPVLRHPGLSQLRALLRRVQRRSCWTLARLTSPESIAEQTGILISQVCPQAADAAVCEAGLSQWWGDMANCLFPAFIGAGDACEQLGLCKVKSVLGDWTCDDCTDIMTSVAAFMVKPETIEQGLAVLNGECFCGAEGHTAECPDLVASLAEPAMQVLSAVLMETTPELCRDIVGVC